MNHLPKQIDESKHHLLHLILKDIAKEAGGYLASDIKGAIQLSKEIYEDYNGYMENQEISVDPLTYNCFGIRYETVEQDSCRGRWHNIWFRDKYFRDAVMLDWGRELSWDDTFHMELKYPTPSCFYGEMEKVFTLNGKMYNEKDGVAP